MSTKFRFELVKEITQDDIDAIIPNPTQGLVGLPDDPCDVQVQFTDDCSVADEVTVTLVATNISPTSFHVVQVQDAFGNWEDTNEAVLTFENVCVDNTTTSDFSFINEGITALDQGNGIYLVDVNIPSFLGNTSQQNQDILDYLTTCENFLVFNFFSLSPLNPSVYTEVALYKPSISNISIYTAGFYFTYDANITSNDSCNASLVQNSHSFISIIANTPQEFRTLELKCRNIYTKPKSSRAKFRVIKCDDTILLYEVAVTDWQNPCPVTVSFLGIFPI
ncbi:MAG: hypothetical protein ACPG5B_02230 [Chitinophagales bacterium]